MKHSSLTRRSFVRMAGIASAASQVKLLHADVASLAQAAPAESEQPKFAYVGVTGPAEALHVYAIERGQWRLQQTLPCEAPVSLALYPQRRALFVLNGISEFEGLPTGSVEAYKIDEKSGLLELLGRQRLSLSATMPRHLAVAPDGQHLVVAVHGGGAYNLLPILDDGKLGRVHSILKETGSGPVAGQQEAAHPQEVLFDPTGKRIIASDLGSDRISVISVEDGFEALVRHQMPAGSGPSQIALHPAGNLLYVSHALEGSLSVFGYDAVLGKIFGLRLRMNGLYTSAFSLDTSGDFLYTAGLDQLSVWKLNPATGGLTHVHSLEVSDEVRGISPLPGSQEMLAVTDRGILEMRFDSISGRLSRPMLVAPAKGARCVAIA